MFGKLFGSFKNIGEKIRAGYNIGKNTYSLDQRILADKTPEVSDDILKARLDRLLDIDRTSNPAGFVYQPVPQPPDLISNNIFDIKPLRFPN